MPRKRKPLRVVTFVGESDLAAAGVIRPGRLRRENDLGPIWRFVSNQIEKGELVEGDCILLLDDKPKNGERETFKLWLAGQIAGSGKNVAVFRKEMSLEGKPTNLTLLFENTRDHIPQNDGYDTWLLLSPGTPAMFATLVLAAEYLKLTNPRLFEVSVEKKVVEVVLPYEIGLRPRLSSRRAPATRTGKNTRLPKLLPNTVIEDSAVQVTFTKLFKQSKLLPWAVLLYGPFGSGKAHAARQLVHWRGCQDPLILDAAEPPTTPELDGEDAIIVCNLQAAQAHWKAWRGLMASSPDKQFVFLWQTDAESDVCVDQAKNYGLAPGGTYAVPGLAVRTDRMALVACFARRAGKWDAKVKERFQFLLTKHDLPRNLHELETWVTQSATFSDGRHPTEIGVELATLQIQAEQARILLQQLAGAIADQSFVGRGVSLETMLKCAEALTVSIQKGKGDSQETIATRLGVSRGTLFAAKKKSDWAQALEDVSKAWPEWTGRGVGST
jgi:hypothetical protein